MRVDRSGCSRGPRCRNIEDTADVLSSIVVAVRCGGYIPVSLAR